MAMSLQGVRKGISMRQGRRPLVRRGESNLLKSGWKEQKSGKLGMNPPSTTRL